VYTHYKTVSELDVPGLPALSDIPSVTVIVPTYRRFEPVLSTIRNLLSQQYESYTIVVADQNDDWPISLQSERDKLREHPKVLWLRLQPPGVVAARNEAVRQSHGEVLIFVDDDVRIDDCNFISRHVANYTDTRIAAISGREMSLSNSQQHSPSNNQAGNTPTKTRDPLKSVLGFDRNTNERVEACVFSTCNCSVRRDVFLDLGGFDENYSGNSYGDDSDFALRLCKTNWLIMYDPGAALIHLKAPLGGLRMSDRTNSTSNTDRVISGWLFYLRHARPGLRWNVLYTQVLRRTIFLRSNVVRPWRQLGALVGLVRGYFVAKQRIRGGIVSRFQSKLVSDGNV
jgi:GT2 family glycosyltransferase